jgi:hypothetical protein
MGKIRDYVRASRRAVFGIAALPLIYDALMLQNTILGPLFGNRTAAINFAGKIVRRMTGMKIVFNTASAPPVIGKQVWYVGNHITGADIIPTVEGLKGTPVGRRDHKGSWLVQKLLQYTNFIGVRQKAAHNDDARGQIIENFNRGYNAVIFPEAKVNKGNDLYMFHAGLFTVLFGEKGLNKKNQPVSLQKEVVVQPVVFRVKEVNGKDALSSKELERKFYAMPEEKSMLRRLWRRMQVKSITIELTRLPPLDPANFNNARDLANQAARDIAAVVNPGQTVFKKAQL